MFISLFITVTGRSDPAIGPSTAGPKSVWESVPARLLTLLIALGFALAGLSAAASDRESVIDEASLRAITFIDADRGWAVGDWGVILHSEDSGLTWRPQESGSEDHLDAVAMFNSQRGVAVGGYYQPHTQIGRGTVLWTSDGGETWKATATAGLPPLRRLLIGPGGKCVAAGDWSSVYGSALFSSPDGGRTWEPVPTASQDPVVGLVGSVDDFLTLSDCGQLVRFRTGEAARSLTPPGSLWKTIAASGDTYWVTGPSADPVDGVISAGMVSGDRGQTWRAATVGRGRPVAASALIHGDQVWRMDEATANLTRSGLDGQADSLSRVAGAPIRSCFRLGDHRAWAVGDWGTIAISRDGGQSWRTVRGESRQPAVMAVAAEGHLAPWSLLAIESLQNHRRVALVTADATPLVRQSLKLVGPAVHYRWKRETDPEAHALPQPWPRADADRGASASEILQGVRPAVLVLEQSLSPAEKTAWTQAAIAHGVQRVFETGRANGQTVHSAAALTSVGLLAGDVWIDSLCLLKPGTLPPDKLRLASRYDAVSDHFSADGLAGFVGGDRRFARSPSGGTSRRHLQILQARTGESAWVDAIVKSTSPVDELMRQVDANLPHIAEENCQRLLLRVIAESKTAGRHELYRAMLNLVATRWPDEPLGLMCRLHLDAIAASGEWRQLFVSESGGSLPGQLAGAATGASVRWSPFQGVGSAPESSPVGEAFEPSGGVRLASATEASWESRVSSTQDPESPKSRGDAAWQSHPAVLTARRLAAGSLAPSSESRLGTSGDVIAEAAAELEPVASWSRAWSDLGPDAESTAALIVPAVKSRPLLDGILNESLWKSSSRFDLECAQSAGLHVAYDADFVYFGVTAPPLIKPPATTDSRFDRPQSDRGRRDIDLDRHDRLVIRIDVDGDLLTAYELEFDGSGNTRDSCDGFVDWQPTWFIAMGDSANRTIAEIAIKRSDLVGPLQGVDQHWNVSVQRRQAGHTTPAIGLPHPSQYRQLIFEH